jgi:small acid-soluble spore protein D (minor alpha/beta-type SASP)
MGSGQKSNKILVPEASKALYQFKNEVAQEVGVANQIQGDYWGNISSRDCGSVGGAMTRKIVQQYEQNLAGQAGQFPQG